MPRKRFGQNFLVDTAVIEKIITAIAPQPTDHIVEIGAGEGALTTALHESGAQLTLIEIDNDLASQLKQQFGNTVEIINADVLKTHWADWLHPNTRLVGNLPYNISTPLLLRFAKNAHRLRDVHIMVQKEVGERLCAKPATSDYGRLTLSVACHLQVEKLLNVPPAAFLPPPQVQSVFLRLLPHPCPPAIPPVFDDIINQAFQQRRKTIANALAAWHINWTAIGIAPTRRPADLSLTDYLTIAKQV